jgi:hypothetical protein
MLDEFFSYDVSSFQFLNDLAWQVEDAVTKIDLPGIPKGSKFDYVVLDFDTCICALGTKGEEIKLKIKCTLLENL